MNHRKSAMGRTRDLGLDSGAGKGDSNRVTDTAAYAANYDAIDWGHGSINPAWVNAPLGIEFPDFKPHDPALEDFESWDR